MLKRIAKDYWIGLPMHVSQWNAALEESSLALDRLPGAQAMHHIVLRATEENISLPRLRMRLRRATAKSAAEKHYPLIMEDLDDLLKGVGDWTTITADLHYRAATALREAEEQARRYWLIEEDISWRPEVGIENCPSWRLLKRLLRRNTLLQKQLLKDPMISWTDESHVEQPVTVFLEAANEQLMRFSYRKFASQQEPRSLRISRILRNKGLPTLGIGWR